jgi:hypothetical protein
MLPIYLHTKSDMDTGGTSRLESSSISWIRLFNREGIGRPPWVSTGDLLSLANSALRPTAFRKLVMSGGVLGPGLMQVVYVERKTFSCREVIYLMRFRDDVDVA